MIIEQNVNTVQTHGIKLSKEMGIHKEGMGFIQNILRSQIYSDKIMAVIREIAVNAIDSHVEAGCPDRPIEVTLPTRNETTLRIRDFGTGMSEDSIVNLYAYYGSSSKRGTNLQAGFMGIGKVAPLAYGDSFILTSYYGGVKNTYNIYVDSENLSQIAKLASEPTLESDGVEVCVAVKDYDVLAFIQKAQTLFQHFKVRPIIYGSDLVYEPRTAIVEGKDWAIYGGTTTALAIMGNIAYPIHNQFGQNEAISAALSCGLEVQFGIGDISVSASRESLEYNTKTKDAIKAKLEEIIKEVATTLNIRFQSCATMFDACKYYGTIMDYGSNLYALRGMIKSSLTFNGKAVLNSDIRFENQNINTFLLRKYESSYKGSKIKVCDYNTISCSDKTVLIYNDLKIANGISNRIYNLVFNSGGKDVYILHYNTEKDKQDFLTETGLVDSNFILLSSLPKIVLSTVSGGPVKNLKHASKEFIYNHVYAAGHTSTGHSNSSYWEKETVDIANDSGVYVILEGFKYEDKARMLVHSSKLNKIIEDLKVFGITIPKLYGFKIAKRDIVLKNSGMISLWNFIEQELTKYFDANKISQKLINRLAYESNSSYSWLPYIGSIAKKVSNTTVLAKANEVFEYMKYSNDKKVLDTAIAWKEYYSMAGKAEHDLKTVASEVITNYPLFENLYWQNNEKFLEGVTQYVNLVGS